MKQKNVGVEYMVKMIRKIPISQDPDKKDYVIQQLKGILSILMTQSSSLIKDKLKKADLFY